MSQAPRDWRQRTASEGEIERLGILPAQGVDIQVFGDMVEDALVGLASGGECEQILFMTWQRRGLALLTSLTVQYMNHELALLIVVDIRDSELCQF